MITSQIKAAVITMTSRQNKDENIEQAITLIKKAAFEGASWVILPEVFSFFGPYQFLYENAEHEDGPLNQQLSLLAKELNIVIFAGSVCERPKTNEEVTENGIKKVFNTTYVFDRTGVQIAKYRKIHLFNLNHEIKEKSYRESDGFLAGDQYCHLEVDGFKVGLAICYDLRFADFFAKLASLQQPDVLIIPAAFTKATGALHWELLLRAKAVEYQCYVCGANQVGEHAPNRETFGHSVIIDPMGQILTNSLEQIGYNITTINLEKIYHTRKMIPSLENRRLELY